MGNFLTDRPSSRVLAAPGGVSQIVFGDNARDVAARKVSPASFTKECRPIGHMSSRLGLQNALWVIQGSHTGIICVPACKTMPSS